MKSKANEKCPSQLVSLSALAKECPCTIARAQLLGLSMWSTWAARAMKRLSVCFTLKKHRLLQQATGHGHVPGGVDP